MKKITVLMLVTLSIFLLSAFTVNTSNLFTFYYIKETNTCEVTNISDQEINDLTLYLEVHLANGSKMQTSKYVGTLLPSETKTFDFQKNLESEAKLQNVAVTSYDYESKGLNYLFIRVALTLSGILLILGALIDYKKKQKKWGGKKIC